jgi:ribonuclease P protein component
MSFGNLLRPARPHRGLGAFGFPERAMDHPSGSIRTPMTTVPSERLQSRHRLTAANDFAALRADGVAHRGAHCLLVALARPGEVTRVAFVASKRGVGGAVDRNRARRRMREIVRRRWSRLPEYGHLLMFVAYRTAPTAPHQDLASDVERVLSAARVLAPIMPHIGPVGGRSSGSAAGHTR